MNWIRVSVMLGDDPRVHTLAAALGVRAAEAAGLLVLLLTKFPEHAPDGNLAHVPASLTERWAGWEGERGAFDAAFRSHFLTDGVWSAWEKHNGAALRDAEASRLRAAEYRRNRLNSSPDGTANGSQNGTVDRSPLRTDGRTNITTGRSRAKNGNGHDPPPRPPVPLSDGLGFAPPFCAVCGGEPNENEKGRIVGLRHKEGCAG